MLPSLLDGISDPLVIKDREHRWVFVNEAFCALVGYPPQALLGQSNRDILPPAEAAIFWQEDDEVLASHRPQQREATLTDAQGRQRIVASHKSSFKDDQGNEFVIATLRDITQQTQVKQALKAQEAMLRQMFDGVDYGIAVVNVEAADQFSLATINHTTSRLLGLSPEDVVGRSIEAVFGPEVGGQMADHYRQCLAAEDSIRYEESVSVNGEAVWGQTTLTPLREEDGSIRRIICTTQDITSRKQVELSLAESEARFRTLLANVPGAIYRCLWDDTWTMVFLSNRVEDLCGYPASEFTRQQRTWADLIHPDDQGWILVVVEAAIAANRSYEVEYRIYHRDGSIRWIYEKGRGSRDEFGTVQFLNGAMFDITDRKQAEAQLRQSEATNRALIQAIPDLLIRMDRDGTYQDIVSRGQLSIISDSELIGSGFSDSRFRVSSSVHESLPPALAEQWLHYTQQALATGITQVYEQQIYVDSQVRYEEVRIAVSGPDEVLVMVRDISDRKRTELQLRDNEARFRSLVENSPGAVYRQKIDQDWTVLFFSDAVEDVLGYPARDFIHNNVRSMASLIHAADSGEVAAKVHEAIASREPFILEYRVHHGDGTLHWVSEKGQVVFDEAGVPLYIDGVVLDITQHRRAEAQLRQLNADLESRVLERTAALQASEDRLRAVLSAAPLILYATDSEGRITLSEGQGLALLGLKPAQAVGQSVFDLYQDYPDIIASIRRALAGEVTNDVMALGDIWFENRYSPILDETGAVTALIGVALDVTQRKQAEQAMQNSQERMALLIQQTPLAVVEWNRDGKVQTWNPAAERIFGYRHDEVIDCSLELLVPPQNRRTVNQIFQDLVEHRQVISGISENRTKDGRLITCEWYNLPLVDSSGTLVGIAGLAVDITERIQAQEEQARLLAIIEATPDLIGIATATGQVSYMNRAGRQLLGLSLEDPLDHLTIADLTPPEHQPYLMAEAVPAAIAQGVWQGETSFLGQDQQVIPVSQVILGHTNETGDLKYLSTIARDISDRKATEDALRKSQRWLRLLIQQAPMAVIEWDMAYRIQAWNPAAAHIFGYAESEALGQGADLLLPEAVKPLVAQICADLSAQRGGARSTNENITKTGKTIVCDWHNTPLIQDDGTVIGYASLVLDITEQARATAAQQQSEAQLRQYSNAIAQLVRDRALEQQDFSQFVEKILEVAAVTLQTNAGLWVLDRQTDRLACQDYYSAVTGHAPQPDLVLHELPTYFQALTRERTIAVNNVLTDPRTQELAIAYAGGDSVMAFMDTSIWLQGEMVAMLGIEVFDDTERHWSLEEISFAGSLADLVTSALEAWQRRQTELALQKSELELREKAAELQHTLDELKRTQAQVIQSEKMSSLGQLVAGVAHEINNPVNFIYGNLTHARTYTADLLGLIDLYQSEYPNPTEPLIEEIEAIDLPFLLEDLPKLLNSMKIGADRIQKIVASLRTFSRMDEAEMKAVSIHDGLDSTVMILQNRIKAKPDRVEIEVVREYGDLPPVECYAGQLNQVFMNIISNAIDAIEEHLSRQGDAAEPPRLTLSTAVIAGEQVKIAIADNGPGIPPQVRQRLFDPFFTTKPIGKGTGMGLSISYQIITEKHGGQLDCIPLATGGTCFEITIPLHQPEPLGPK